MIELLVKDWIIDILKLWDRLILWHIICNF